jgi:hypothetical protein
MAINLECPSCGSEDLNGTRASRSGPIAMHCNCCGNDFQRAPTPSCPRCASVDVAGRPVSDSWAFDDAERTGPMAEWSYIQTEQYECQKCHHSWRTHPGESWKSTTVE